MIKSKQEKKKEKINAELVLAILGINKFHMDMIIWSSKPGYQYKYDEESGTYIRFSNKVYTRSMFERLKYFHIDKEKHLDRSKNQYDLIMDVLYDNAIELSYHYYLIPKKIMKFVLSKSDFIKSCCNTFTGECVIKNTSLHHFRDEEDVVVFNNGEINKFIALFDGSKCFILIQSNEQNKADIMFKTTNPWQFNKYFKVKKECI